MKTKTDLTKLKKIINEPPISLNYAVTFTGWMNKKGNVVHATNTACHAALGYPDTYKDVSKLGSIDFVWSKVMDHDAVSGQSRDMFINYMLKESPWSACFLNESVEEVLQYGWLISADTDAHLLVNAMVATRLMTEFSGNRFDFFCKAIANGMDKNMAMVLSMFCISSDDTFYLSTCGGHGFVYDVSTKIISNFINKTPVLGRGPYKEVKTYGRHCDVWDGGGSDYSKTTSKLETIPVYKTVEKVNLNIFYKEKRMTGYTYHPFSSSKYFEQKVKEKLIA